MTIDKREVITIPKWLVIVVLPMIISGLVAFGSISTWKGSIETKTSRNEKEIETLFTKKVEYSEYNRLFMTLERIEKKIDEHIASDKNN